MDTYIWGIIGFIVLFILLAIKIPIAFSFIIVGFAGLALIRGINVGFQNSAINAWVYTSDSALAAIPLFTLMGVLLYETGITHDLFEVAQKWLGGIKGGLALATIAACTIFAATSGSSLAAVASLGVVAYKEMKLAGYDRQLSMGTILSGGNLAILIPPSNTMIIYGILANESIGKLFIGGILPGIILSAGLALTVIIRVKFKPGLAPVTTSVSWKERFACLPKVLPVIVLIVALMGGLYGGLFVPTEAAGFGAFISFLIALASKKLTKKGFISALRETMNISVMIFIIIIGVNSFQVFLVSTGLTPMISKAVASLHYPALSIAAIMIAVYIPLGCVMDIVGMLAITIPVFQPIIASLGLDPIWFGILVTMMCELGLITPPVGLSCFVFKNVVGEDATLHAIFASAVPFYVAILLAITIVFFFPQIATYLPSHM